jgi:hypothetical protein
VWGNERITWPGKFLNFFLLVCVFLSHCEVGIS